MMKTLLFVLALFFVLSCNESKKMEEKDFVEEALFRKVFHALDSVWTDDDKKVFREQSEQELIDYHMSVGMWIRNNYLRGKNTDTALVDTLLSLGLRSPDDISAVVLEAYHKRLNGKEINLEDLAKPYKEYWEKMNQNKESK